MGGKWLGIIALVLATPYAVADDPFREPVCVRGNCVGFGGCTPVCIPPSCYPAADCRGEVDDGVGLCAVNVTIDGRTCSIVVGVGLDNNGGVDVPEHGRAGGASAWAGVAVTNGSVDEYNLQNSWLSPRAELDVEAAGVDGGRTSVGAYRSDIVTEGPRGGPYGEISPSDDHTWTQFTVVVQHREGVAAIDDIQFSMWFLDYVPDGCHVRSPPRDGPDVECPPLQTVTLLV